MDLLSRLPILCALVFVAACAVNKPLGPPPERGAPQESLPTPPSPVVATPPAPATQPVSPAGAEGRFASVAIEALLVKGRAPKTGYSRGAFGPDWADTDRNGCDTRNDVLKRDLTEITFKPRTRDCVVLEGILQDPYSGEAIVFQRGELTSSLVQIDHVVSLSNAWQTGMFQRTPEERQRFANDLLNLLAVKGSLNAQKSDGDTATWLPPLKSYRCEFVARQIAVKEAYQLWLTKPEKEAMVRVLQACPNQVLPTRVAL
ncbi:MAG: HNH endonuclease family protein [Gammaproteobacteria bacterium]